MNKLDEIMENINKAMFVLELFKEGGTDGELLYNVVNPFLKTAYDLADEVEYVKEMG